MEKNTRAFDPEGFAFDLQRFAEPGAGDDEGVGLDLGSEGAEPGSQTQPTQAHVWDEATGTVKVVPIEEAKRGYMGQRETSKRFQVLQQREAELARREAELSKIADVATVREAVRTDPRVAKLVERVKGELQADPTHLPGSAHVAPNVNDERIQRLERVAEMQLRAQLDKDIEGLKGHVKQTEGRDLTDDEIRSAVDYEGRHGHGTLTKAYQHMRVDQGALPVSSPDRVTGGIGVAGKTKELTEELVQKGNKGGRMSMNDIVDFYRKNNPAKLRGNEED
jgi:hypothetical protein